MSRETLTGGPTTARAGGAGSGARWQPASAARARRLARRITNTDISFIRLRPQGGGADCPVGDQFATHDAMLEPVDYEANGRAYRGFLADGSGGEPAPGIVVAHEGGGLTGHARERAERLAGLGYVAFALDLFGDQAPSLDDKMALVRSLRADTPPLRARAAAALEVLTGQAKVDRDRLAAIGFCFGGTTMIELARGGAPLKAVV